MHYEYMTLNVGGKVRKAKLEGRNHLVAPVAMIAEGVWIGNRGKILYTDKELQRCVPTCDHKPAILGHPRPGVSGCDPDVINRRKVGVVLNTKQKSKLRSECWIDEDRCAELDVRVLNSVRSGHPIECSTGLVMQFKKQKGVFDNKEYEVIAKNIRMDHLAVITDGVGAYSCKDGGGINVLNEAMKQVPEAILASLVRGVDDRLLRVGANFVNNTLSFNIISVQVCELLGAKFGEPGKYWTGHLYEVYDGYVIFSKGDGTSDLHLIDYTIKGDSVSLTGDAKPVRRVVEYRADNGAYIENSIGQLALNSEDSPMAKFDKKAHVTALIEAGLYEETDREGLEGLSDATLQKIKTDKVSNQKPPVKKTKIVEDEGPDDDDDDPPVTEKKKVKVVANESPKQPTLKELLAQADPRDREAYEEAQESLDRERTDLVGIIVANKANQFTEEWLKLRPVKELRGLSAIARVNNTRGPDDDDDDEDNDPPMFIGAGGVRSRRQVQNQAKDLPLLLPPGAKETKEDKEVA